MTTQDEQAFLAAIVATPDDDTPRLVFADWLDERARGDDAARAALIRAQCQLEHLAPGGKERRALEKQAKAILKEHEGKWAKALSDAGIVDRWEFRRGFIDGVTMSATGFALDPELLFRVAPTVRTARFPNASNQVGELAECEYFARLASVDLSRMCLCDYCPIQNDLRALFRSKHAQSLTKLNVAGDRMDAAGVKRLAASAALARLTTLDVSDNPFSADGVLALGKAKHLKHLTTLNLSGTEVPVYNPADPHAGAEAVAALNNLPALTHLGLSNNGYNAAAVRTIVAAPLFAQLVSLDLSHNPIRPTGAKVLAALPATAKLESLDVRKCSLTEPAIRALKKRFGKGVKV